METKKRVDKGKQGNREKAEARGGDGQRLDFISFCLFDVSDAYCWPASAILTNSSPRQPLISALQPPTFFFSLPRDPI